MSDEREEGNKERWMEGRTVLLLALGSWNKMKMERRVMDDSYYA